MRLFICYGEHFHEGYSEPRAIFGTLEEAQAFWEDYKGDPVPTLLASSGHARYIQFYAQHIDEWDSDGKFRPVRYYRRETAYEIKPWEMEDGDDH